MPVDERAPFGSFPSLRDRLPRVPLARLPTPVVRLRALEAALGAGPLWMKRDDLASPVFGGNKTRKLELILGALEAAGARRAITFGFAGSNHVAATALFCAQREIGCTAMLLDGPCAPGAREALLVALGAGAELRLYPDLPRLVAGAIAWRLLHPGPRGRPAPMIAAGGSTPEGNAAYVGAALELKRQIDAGVLGEPAEIHVACGSLGTAAGLLVGLRAAGLGSRLIAVRATDGRFARDAALLALARKTARFLARRDPSFPRVGIAGAEVEHGYCGAGYGAPTEEGASAARLLGESEGIRLDPVYTAKAFARFLDSARRSGPGDAPLLFWNTCNAADLSTRAAAVDPGAVPPPLRRFLANA